MDIEPPKSLGKPLFIPQKLLMGPGPSNCSPRVLRAMNQPILGHLHWKCLEIMDEIKQGIQYIFQTKNPLTLAISGSGHSGMEAIMSNLLEDGDKILIARNGFWGFRAATMAERYGATVAFLDSEPGNNFTLIQIENTIATHRPVLFFIVQGESSTGVYQEIEGIGDICRRYNCLLAVDAVASLGCVPLLMDRWSIDAVYTGSQKVLGAPPGITPISFSNKAQERIFNRKSLIKVFYWDMKILGDYWNCYNNPRIYHHTISSTLLYGLREALASISDEKLENVIERHRKCAEEFYKGLQQLGLELYVDDIYKRLPSITAVKMPENLDNKEIIKYSLRRYSLEISPGLGSTSNQILRIGFMGNNATLENVNFVLKVLKEAISYLNVNKTGSKL